MKEGDEGTLIHQAPSLGGSDPDVPIAVPFEFIAYNSDMSTCGVLRFITSDLGTFIQWCLSVTAVLLAGHYACDLQSPSVHA